jgi:hypothetical protein
LIVFLKDDQGSIKVDVCTLQVVDTGAPGKNKISLSTPDEFLDRVEDVLIRVEDHARRLYPQGEILLGGGQSLVQMQQIYLREQTRRVSRMLERAEDRRAKQTTKSSGARVRAATVKKYKRQLAKVINEAGAENVSFGNELFAHNLHHLLSELSARSNAFGDDLDDYLLDLLNETSLLNALSSVVDSEPRASQTLGKV